MNAVDYIVLGLYLAVIGVMGWCLRLRRRGADEFFLAGRDMGVFALGLSVMVTVFSAVNYLALPNEVFGYGLAVIVALPVFFLAAWPVTRIWMPFFHGMRLTSVYAYLEHRFDGRVRSLASGVFILWRLCWMATALYASGTIMAVLTGLPVVPVILLGGLVATAYTTLGGMRAVMWTDVLQFFVLFGGIVLGLVYAAGSQGLGTILSVAREGGRLRPFVPLDPGFFSFDPRLRMTLWSGLLGVFVAFLARYGADQVVMQRYFTARSLRAAQRGLWLNAAVSVLSLSLLALFGLAVYAAAIKNGLLEGLDLATLPAPQRKALAMRSLAGLIRSFPSGLAGLIGAGLLAATMSSIDSGINACSAAYLTDLHGRLFRRDTQSAGSQALSLRRGLTGILGVLATALALGLIPLVGRTHSLFMIVNKLINGLGSPLLALFLLGMFSRRANAPGVWAGALIGVPASLAISLWLQPLALQYYAVVNLLVTWVPCYTFSWLAVCRGYRPDPRTLQWTWFARGNRT